MESKDKTGDRRKAVVDYVVKYGEDQYIRDYVKRVCVVEQGQTKHYMERVRAEAKEIKRTR